MLLNLEGRRLRYELLGSGEGAVVCLAHSLSAHSSIWAEQVPALLQQGWTVLRPDMRGHGGSDPGAGECSMADLADDVVAVLDHLGLQQVHFVGLSIGGIIGQTLALEHGDRLLSLMLCGTSPKAVPGGLPMWQARYAAIRAAGSLEPLADETMTRWFTEDFAPRRPDR